MDLHVNYSSEYWAKILLRRTWIQSLTLEPKRQRMRNKGFWLKATEYKKNDPILLIE